MNNENNNENNNDLEVEDLNATEEARLAVKNSLEKLLPIYNENFSLLNNYLEKNEKNFEQEQLVYGTDLLTEITERLSAIRKLNKVLMDFNDEVFNSDIDLCNDFITETDDFINDVKSFINN